MGQGMAEGDIDTLAAQDWLGASGCRRMVHGHTHRPGRTDWAHSKAREVLSDWDLDDPLRPRAEVMRWTADGLARIPVTLEGAVPSITRP
jgi:UDP-2,3-diacylglucosamine hydrolase